MLVGLGRRAARSGRTRKRNHLDHDCAVIVGEPGQGTRDDDLATEFFPDFTPERLLGRFARLDLAAWKFPFEPEMFVGGTLRKEDAAGAVDEDGADNGNR